ncbi:lysine-specific demethylase 5-like [Bacillus rossius redtenbacheri]|uniref:lysine-specific demethylase 5-like n=1 Tax=Bacillus rossius redtenbacheri TaxID=93214 RepID=UPI002FDDF7E4
MTASVKHFSGSKPKHLPDFQFVVPKEAPVFEPSNEEFEDALAFIRKIRPIGEKFGICKIKPPTGWQPPFTVDVDHFRFTPRIQRLNELEAKTRIKLNFLDQIAKFWELQGSCLKIPAVEKRALDLYTLHKLVQEEGGQDAVTRDRKWNFISNKMGFPSGKGVDIQLKGHYARILHPYDIFQEGKEVKQMQDEPVDIKKQGQNYKPHGIPSRQDIKPPFEKHCRRSKRYGTEDEQRPKIEDQSSSSSSTDVENKELRRLTFYGAGPKMAGYHMIMRELKSKSKSKKKKRNKIIDPLSKYVCRNCGRGDAEESMLLCDGCDDSYHTFCLKPPLTEIPKGDWRCPKCIAEEVSKPMEAFGFEQARREYNLQQFGEMADQFKTDYFRMPAHTVPTHVVEREFWRLVSSIDEDVTVEYGADLHTMDHGSGFPTKYTQNLHPIEQKYADSTWNLNNLPVLDGSVLGYINADVSGMKVPWMYVGMCFATFCWHNEDHWSYSINYLHWGEPKTWYGVPGGKAELFESSMKMAAPELFHSQPDLLHQLVTIMNPNILMEAGVPVCRTDQHAGEFVITFPRAYHAGFNQGYNFAEAVNFAPADWLRMGRDSISHYSTLRRFCVFSHDELVCKMASEPGTLDSTVALATYRDMYDMVSAETKLRKSLLEWGVTNSERVFFENLPDDERQCEMCKTTCYLSAVACGCNAKRIVCLKHYALLCDCPPKKHTMKYRYILDELLEMLQRVKFHAESFEQWAECTKRVLNDPKFPKPTLSELNKLVSEAEEKKIPEELDLIQDLKRVVLEGEKYSNVARQLLSRKPQPVLEFDPKPTDKLTKKELNDFHKEIENLRVVIPERAGVKEFLENVKSFERDALKALAKDNPVLEELKTLVETGASLDVYIPQFKKIKEMWLEARWNEEVKTFEESAEDNTLVRLNAIVDTGSKLPAKEAVTRSLEPLRKTLSRANEIEQKAGQLIQSGRKKTTPFLVSQLLECAKNINCKLPTVMKLADMLAELEEWQTKVKQHFVEKGMDKFPPTLTAVDDYIRSGQTLSISAPLLPALKLEFARADTWLSDVSSSFLKKNSAYSLLEVLCPRSEFGLCSLKRRKFRSHKCSACSKTPLLKQLLLQKEFDMDEIVAAMESAVDYEINGMRSMRETNVKKLNDADSCAKYCICRRGSTGFMFQCELCKDLFHTVCVPPSKSQLFGGDSSKFMCPLCLRSLRPSVKTISSFLMQQASISITIPEGEALEFLAKRISRWRKKVHNAFSLEEVKRVSGMIPRAKQQSVAEKHLVEDADDPDTIIEITNVTNLGLNRSRDRKTVVVNQKKQKGKQSAGNPDSSGNQNETDAGRSPVQDDEGSSDVEIIDDVDLDEDRRYEMKVSAVQSVAPCITLSEHARLTLEDLMMEGDLMEASLEENNQIWRLLKHSRTFVQKHAFPEAAGEEPERPVEESRPEEEATPPAEEEGKQDKERQKGKKRPVGPRDEGVPGKRSRVLRKRPRPEAPTQERPAPGEGDSTLWDDGEDCAAQTCLHPPGSSLDWVQCDGGCEEWFHLHCVGLGKDELDENEDYICKVCRSSQGGSQEDEVDFSCITMAELDQASDPLAAPAPRECPDSVILVPDSDGEADCAEETGYVNVEDLDDSDSELVTAESLNGVGVNVRLVNGPPTPSK